MKKTAVLLVLLLVVLALAGCRQGETPAPSRGPAATTTGSNVGSAFPEYTAMNLDGTRFDLAARGNKVVLLNLWATWCGPCRYEIPELQRIHDKYGPRGFEVVGVSVDESGVETVKQFVDEQEKMTYPVALDPQGKLATLLETSVLPTTVLLDRTGKVVWRKIGAIEENDTELDAAIKKAL